MVYHHQIEPTDLNQQTQNNNIQIKMVRKGNSTEIDEQEEEAVLETEVEDERVDKGKSQQKKQTAELIGGGDDDDDDVGVIDLEVEVEEEDVDEETRKKREDERYRRALRERLFQLSDEVDNSQTRLMQPGSQELLNKFQESERLSKRIAHARETAIDAGIFSKITRINLAQVNSIHEAQQFDAKMIIANIIGKYKKEDGDRQRAETENNESVNIDWVSLGREVIHHFNTVPTIAFMNGPLQKTQTRQIQRKPRKSTENEEENVTKVVEIETQTRQDETSLQVMGLFRKLKTLQEQVEERRLAFIDLTIDPNSFTKSIENLFHFSFLVKDGKACLSLDENEPKTFITDQKSGTDKAGKQCVLKLDLDTWKKLAKKLTPKTESLNGHQSPANESGKRPNPDTQDKQSGRKKRRK